MFKSLGSFKSLDNHDPAACAQMLNGIKQGPTQTFLGCDCPKNHSTPRLPAGCAAVQVSRLFNIFDGGILDKLRCHQRPGNFQCEHLEARPPVGAVDALSPPSLSSSLTSCRCQVSPSCVARRHTHTNAVGHNGLPKGSTQQGMNRVGTRLLTKGAAVQKVQPIKSLKSAASNLQGWSICTQYGSHKSTAGTNAPWRVRRVQTSLAP